MDNYGEQQINLEPENVEQQIELEEEPVIINQGGTQNYNELTNKPSINDITLEGNKTSQDLGLADDDDINNLQSQIDAITVSSDVVDVLGTYQDLLNYDTSELGDNDIVKVLQDSTHGDAMSYYRWDSTKWTAINVVDEIPNNYMTTDTAQDVSGAKTFTSSITMRNNNRIKYANSYGSGCSIGNDGGGTMRFFNAYNTGMMDFTGSVLRPATASTNLDLGASSIQWNDLYLKGSLSDGTNSVSVADLKALVDYAKTQGWIN